MKYSMHDLIYDVNYCSLAAMLQYILQMK